MAAKIVWLLLAMFLLITASLKAQDEGAAIIYMTAGASTTRDIRVIDPQTGDERAASTWQGNWWTSAFAPNSWQIAINDNSGNLHILDLNQETDSEFPAPVYIGPVWSPDGTRIAFTAPEGDDPQDDEIEILDLATGETQTFAQSAFYVLTLAWSPDSNEIAFSNLSTDSLGVVNLAEDHIRYLLNDLNDSTDFVWSPDGTELALFDHFPTNAQATSIRLVNALTGEVRLRVEVEGYALHPAWSPDGSQIIFAVDDLYLLDAETGAISRLAELEGFESSPQWSPDGEQVAFISDLTGAREIRLFTLATGELRQLTNSDASTEPRGFAWVETTSP